MRTPTNSGSVSLSGPHHPSPTRPFVWKPSHPDAAIDTVLSVPNPAHAPGPTGRRRSKMLALLTCRRTAMASMLGMGASTLAESRTQPRRHQSLLAITSRLLMSGGEAKSSSAFSARAFPTGPPRCLSRADSSGNASIMPHVDGQNRTANHGFVPGSCSTSGSAERRNHSLYACRPSALKP